MSKKPKAYKVRVADVGDKIKIVTWPTHAESKKTLGSIIFDPTDPDVWGEKSPPPKKAHLVVDDLREYDGGWRAHSVRYFRTEDVKDSEIVQ